MPDWVAGYHRLPYSLRVIAASGRGAYLNWWRYGAETDRLVEEAFQRESWGNDRWKNWQEERLALMLELAATRVPYYRRHWDKRRQKGDRASWKELENWPILRKEQIRVFPEAFVADEYKSPALFREQTSGTTGTPLKLWLNRKAIMTWYALFEARCRNWNGISRHDRWAMLGGQLVVPFEQKRPPFWVWNAASKQLYLSSYHLSSPNLSAYLQAIHEHQITYLLGYASSLFSLALASVDGNDIPQLKVIISNAEPLYEHQRKLIIDVFGCTVIDSYGLSEIVCGASECSGGNLHLWPEAGYWEVLQDDWDRPVDEGKPGRLVCTGLLNPAMPLIRYEVGDRVAIAPKSERCSCGRGLPILKSVDGRVDDVILTKDGRRIGRLDPVFKADLPIKEAQIIQESISRVRLRYVPTSDFVESDQKSIIQRLQQRLGDMKITLEVVETIPRSSNGKFRAVISNINKTIEL